MLKTSFLFTTIIIIIGITIITGLLVTSISNNAVNALAQKQQTSSDPVKITAGGGNANGPLTVFKPSEVRIKVNQTVIWYNPTTVGEPHTVTFVLSNNTMAGVVSPLAVSNITKFVTLPPNSNNEPILIPGKNGINTVIAMNARTYNPTVIDYSGNVKFMNTNANYSMAGNEKYVNSGWILPKGHEQEYPGSGNTFTIKFEKLGTYNYICILHPWMSGRVMVE